MCYRKKVKENGDVTWYDNG